ncbi:MAG: tetratricopeptide repeat protein [Lachnospiraceae bacterium]|jgi:tetratricopeptide (TPR) repeat protein|nr:tetratricopeptide repeat protein [Lachnospiraceae bacterium]
MNCIYCGTPLSAIDYCTGCGADITLQKRIIRISNLLYNQGLEKATVRDLSGAIVCLKRSLKFNKENIDARNLLGLVYFETGEVVSALSEWVISKNMNVQGNPADGYIDKLQANKNKLDVINQTIRKYNQALLYCRQDNEDMAIIQLKKVLIQNPRLIKAYHLLSLLYLKRQEYEKARKLLKKAAFIDATNTTTLRYLQEVELATGISTSLDVKRKKRYAKEKVNKLTGTTTYMSGNEMIIQPTTFRDSSAVATFINICLGLILGGAIVWFLVVPGTKQNIYQEANKQVTDANTKMASEVSRVQGLEQEIEDYKAKVEEANATMEEANAKADSYEELLGAADLFVTNPNSQAQAAEALAEIDAGSLSGSAKDLYDHLMEAISDYVYSDAVGAGDTAYMSGDYRAAIEHYEKAVEAKPDDAHALQYLGISYYQIKDTTNADRVLNEFIQKFPARAAEVQAYISGNGGGTRQGNAGNSGGTGESGAPGENPQGSSESDSQDENTGNPDETGNGGTSGDNPSGGSTDRESGGISGPDRLGLTQ